MLNIAIIWHSVMGIKKSIKYFFIQLNYYANSLRLHHIQECIVTFVIYLRIHQDLLPDSRRFYGVENV